MTHVVVFVVLACWILIEVGAAYGFCELPPGFNYIRLLVAICLLSHLPEEKIPIISLG